MTARPVRVAVGSVLGLALAVVVGSACGRTPVERAAVRAQDACITALDPVSEDRRLSPADLRSALSDAEAAARVDQRWAPLLERVRNLASVAGSGEGGAQLDALVQECDRVNQIVKENRDDV